MNSPPSEMSSHPKNHYCSVLPPPSTPQLSPLPHHASHERCRQRTPPLRCCGTRTLGKKNPRLLDASHYSRERHRVAGPAPPRRPAPCIRGPWPAVPHLRLGLQPSLCSGAELLRPTRCAASRMQTCVAPAPADGRTPTAGAPLERQSAAAVQLAVQSRLGANPGEVGRQQKGVCETRAARGTLAAAESEQQALTGRGSHTGSARRRSPTVRLCNFVSLGRLTGGT